MPENIITIGGQKFGQVNGKWFYLKSDDTVDKLVTIDSMIRTLNATINSDSNTYPSLEVATERSSLDVTDLWQKALNERVQANITSIPRLQETVSPNYDLFSRRLLKRLSANGNLPEAGQQALAEKNAAFQGKLNTAGNAAGFIGMGIDVVGNMFGTNKNYASTEVDGYVDAGANALLSSGNPYAMMTGAAIKGVSVLSNLTGGHAHNFELDTDIESNLGSSYSGAYSNMHNAADKAGKRYNALWGNKARHKANAQIAEATRQLNLLSDINSTNQDALASSRDPRVALRAQSTLSGGYNSMAGNVAVGKEGLKFAKRVLDPKNWYYVLEDSPLKFEKGGESKRKRKYPTYDAWIQYLGERGKDPEYDYQAFYNDEPAYFKWEDLEERAPGQAHMSGDYKKPGHITYGGYDGFGWMGDDEAGWVFYPSPQQLKRYSYEDYVKYWDKNEPESILMYPGHPGYRAAVSQPDPQKFKEGGSFNVIPEGALHARLHHMENADDITKKGIPVVTEDSGGNLTQHAEIERNEIIFRLEVTKKIEELRKDGSDEAAIEAGKLLTKEILYNTHDNTGLLNEIQ